MSSAAAKDAGKASGGSTKPPESDVVALKRLLEQTPNIRWSVASNPISATPKGRAPSSHSDTRSLAMLIMTWYCCIAAGRAELCDTKLPTSVRRVRIVCPAARDHSLEFEQTAQLPVGASVRDLICLVHKFYSVRCTACCYYAALPAGAR